MALPTNASLVRYNNPILISRNTDKKGNKIRPGASQPQKRFGAGGVGTAGGGKQTGNQYDENKTEEILNQILPPREWEDVGQMWAQRVSSTPATRQDIINLQEELDRRLQQRQSHETGICPSRRELYEQCFDELIRQETINCMERGLLLVRVHEEIKRTLAAYQTLYESTVAYGMRKALQAGQMDADMKSKVKELEQDKSELSKQVNDLQNRCQMLIKKDEEERADELKKRGQEIMFLRKTNQQLKSQLEGVLAPASKK